MTLPYSTLIARVLFMIATATAPESIDFGWMAHGRGVHMRQFVLRVLALLIVLISPLPAHAEVTTSPAGPATAPAGGFEREIRAFEAADARQAPPRGGVLFLGSSSIRKWTTLTQDFAGQTVLNRGFGGSQIHDSTRYASRIVIPYMPRLIVFYAGDNDLAAGRSPEQLLADFKELVGVIHAALPRTRVLFVSIKPSPARVKLLEKMKEANRLIRQFTDADQALGYIDVFTPMLSPDGQPRPELFGPDHLHMNHEGYELWTSIIAPRLSEAPQPASKPA